jgi:hypothetical protein
MRRANAMSDARMATDAVACRLPLVKGRSMRRNAVSRPRDHLDGACFYGHPIIPMACGVHCGPPGRVTTRPYLIRGLFVVGLPPVA